jgi:hypothetical protein
MLSLLQPTGITVRVPSRVLRGGRFGDLVPEDVVAIVSDKMEPGVSAAECCTNVLILPVTMAGNQEIARFTPLPDAPRAPEQMGAVRR